MERFNSWLSATHGATEQLTDWQYTLIGELIANKCDVLRYPPGQARNDAVKLYVEYQEYMSQ